MDRRKKEALDLLSTRHVLFSCEGKAERVIVTRLEVERLVLVKEGQLDAFQKRRGSDRHLNASDWCIQKLHMDDVKSERFLEGYWSDPDELVRCIREAHRKAGKGESAELELADLLR